MIKDIKEFEKLFKINIPDKNEFDYYISILKKSAEHFGIEELVHRFTIFEEFVKDSEYSSISHYKMKGAFDVLKEYVEETKAYKRFLEFDYSGTELYSIDKLKSHENKNSLFLSFDFRQANYNTMKFFDTEGELASGWESLLIRKDIHPVLGESKSFRQLFFGNLNPKRSQKIQHTFMLEFVKNLEKQGITKDGLVFLSHDEVILNWCDKDSVTAKYLQEFINDNGALSIEVVDEEMELIKGYMPLKASVFTLDKIPETRVYKKTIFGFEEKMYQNPAMPESASYIKLEEKYKFLWGVPGNKFYMFFKKYILEEEIDERDLIFFADGQLAKWII